MSIFQDKRVLLHNFTPLQILHREKELQQLWRYFQPVLKEGVNAKIHVHGKIGTGKTVLCRRFGPDLEAEGARLGMKLHYIHVNLAHAPSPTQIMVRVVDQLPSVEAPKSGLSPGDLLFHMAETLKDLDEIVVLTLDEVDTYVQEKGSQKILYMLCRIHELYPDPVPRLSLIYVSRSLGWMDKLEPATLDTLGRVSGVHLEDYGVVEMKDILISRVEQAFQLEAVSESIIDFVADISARHGGVRYALELLLEAGEQADLDFAGFLEAEHVRRGHAKIPKGVNGAYYPFDLSLHKQLLLSGVISALEDASEPYLSQGEAFEGYLNACMDHDREAKSEDLIPGHLRSLQMEGYLLLKDGGNLVSTEFPVLRLKQAVEKALENSLKVPHLG